MLTALFSFLADVATTIGVGPQVYTAWSERRRIFVKYRLLPIQFDMSMQPVAEITNLSNKPLFVDWWCLAREDHTFWWNYYNDHLPVNSSPFKIEPNSQVTLQIPIEYTNHFVSLSDDERKLFLLLKTVDKKKETAFFLLKPEPPTGEATEFKLF